MKRIFIILILSVICFMGCTQKRAPKDRSVYIVFTGVEFGTTNVGIHKNIDTGYDTNKYNWPDHTFFIFRTHTYDFMYLHENVKNKPDRQQTINLYHKSFLNQVECIDWDIVGPTLTTEAVAKQKIAEIESYDKIYFIDRNDITADNKIKVVEAKRFIIPVQ